METTHNSGVEKWSGFYKTAKEAEESLQKELNTMSLKKLIVSAKKELIVQDKNAMLLYKFTVVTSVKNCD
jgi:hypothetical protein